MTTEIGKRWRRWLRADLLGFTACVVFFLAFPSADIPVSALFWDGASFPLNEHPVFWVIYKFFANVHFLGLAGLPILIWRNRRQSDELPQRTLRRKRYVFLLVTLLVGPGLITHIVLKDNSFGRPRPHQTERFGGEHPYAAPFEVSESCPRNCSFVSGHAAIAFFFITFAWAYRQRVWFYVGAGLWVIVGGARVLQGDHFLSDIVFSVWVVYAVSLFFAWRFGLRFVDRNLEAGESDSVTRKDRCE